MTFATSTIQGSSHGLMHHRRDEAALAAAAATGDREAQELVLEQVLPRVRAIARLLVRDPADVDDAVQEACIEILKSVRGFDGRGSLPAWAARIAERHVLRHLERRRRRWSRTRPTEQEYLDAAPAPYDEDSLGEGLPRRVESYLRELPEVQRTALVLRHCLGHSLAEIGELTGVSISTVRGRLRLGAQALRKQVRQDLSVGSMRKDERRLLASMGAMPLFGMGSGLGQGGMVTAVRQAPRLRWVAAIGLGTLVIAGGWAAGSDSKDLADPSSVQAAPIARGSNGPTTPIAAPSSTRRELAPTAQRQSAAPVAVEGQVEVEVEVGASAAPESTDRSVKRSKRASADELLEAAQTALATGSREEAIAAYRTLVKRYPGSKAARVGRVTLEELTR